MALSFRETDVWALGVVCLDLFEPRRLGLAAKPLPPADDDDGAVDGGAAGGAAPFDPKRRFDASPLLDVRGEAAAEAFGAYCDKDRRFVRKSASDVSLWIRARAAKTLEAAPTGQKTTRAAAALLAAMFAAPRAAAPAADVGAPRAAADAPAAAIDGTRLLELSADPLGLAALLPQVSLLPQVPLLPQIAAADAVAAPAARGAAVLLARLVDEAVERFAMPDDCRAAISGALAARAVDRPADANALHVVFEARSAHLAHETAAEAAAAEEAAVDDHGARPSTATAAPASTARLLRDRSCLCCEVGAALVRLGRAGEATRWFDEAVGIVDALPPARPSRDAGADARQHEEQHRLAALVWCGAAHGAVAVCDFDRAQHLLARAKWNSDQFYGPGHPATAAILCALSDAALARAVALKRSPAHAGPTDVSPAPKDAPVAAVQAHADALAAVRALRQRVASFPGSTGGEAAPALVAPHHAMDVPWLARLASADADDGDAAAAAEHLCLARRILGDATADDARAARAALDDAAQAAALADRRGTPPRRSAAKRNSLADWGAQATAVPRRRLVAPGRASTAPGRASTAPAGGSRSLATLVPGPAGAGAAPYDVFDSVSSGSDAFTDSGADDDYARPEDGDLGDAPGGRARARRHRRDLWAAMRGGGDAGPAAPRHGDAHGLDYVRPASLVGAAPARAAAKAARPALAAPRPFLPALRKPEAPMA
ncbi:hypothetical protein M885DRAFT_549885 [Pelagophyceae sp. CCMP2097]|nr:hypothetical protein M885DRAFT_549885 [Pelagophyceae sp. CCMP2097]